MRLRSDQCRSKGCEVRGASHNLSKIDCCWLLIAGARVSHGSIVTRLPAELERLGLQASLLRFHLLFFSALGPVWFGRCLRSASTHSTVSGLFVSDDSSSESGVATAKLRLPVEATESPPCESHAPLNGCKHAYRHRTASIPLAHLLRVLSRQQQWLIGDSRREWCSIPCARHHLATIPSIRTRDFTTSLPDRSGVRIDTADACSSLAQPHD